MPQREAFDHYHQGQMFEEKKQYKQALSAYEQAIDLDPTIAGFHVACRRIFSLLSSYQEAERAFMRAIQIDASLVEAYNECAYALRQLHVCIPSC